MPSTVRLRRLLPALVAVFSCVSAKMVHAQDSQQESRNPVITLVPSKPSEFEPTLVHLLEQARRCAGSQCRFLLGTDFQISLTGVGQSNAGIVYERSNFEGNYYASFGLAHGCVIVQTGLAQRSAPRPHEFAFIQPRTGKVFKTWQECKAD